MTPKGGACACEDGKERIQTMDILRRSPILFTARAARTEHRDNWEVVLEYENQGSGPHIIDLSHRRRWDLQTENFSSYQPFGITIPDAAGQCAFGDGILVFRLNPGQATIWHLSGRAGEIPLDTDYTEITESSAVIALAGAQTFALLEKATSLDFSEPGRTPPFLVQGPVFRVPCQVVCLEAADNRHTVLVACARGYGQSMADAFLKAGMPWKFQVAGEDALSDLHFVNP
jgi:hypothetical protein